MAGLKKAGANWVDGDRFFDRGAISFVSGLLEDWWRARHGRHFVPIQQRIARPGA